MPISNIKKFDSRLILGKYGIQNKIEDFLTDLLETNEKINLVSRETKFEDLIRITADCLIPFEFISKPTGRILDIGAGAGFPSLVILTAFPNLSGILIERNFKKAHFLEKTIRRLGISAEVINKNFIEIDFGSHEPPFDQVFIKLLRPNKNMISRIFKLLKYEGKLVYYASSQNLSFDIPQDIEISEYAYILDNKSQTRFLTTFSKKH
jgi:16S rRNA (guanine527-N7)-methyltransferase